MEDSTPATVELVVKLAPTVVAGSTAHRALLERAAGDGVALEPVAPGVSDPELSTYFTALVTEDTAARAAEQLRAYDGIDAVYAKPRGEAP